MYIVRIYIYTLSKNFWGINLSGKRSSSFFHSKTPRNLWSGSPHIQPAKIPKRTKNNIMGFTSSGSRAGNPSIPTVTANPTRKPEAEGFQRNDEKQQLCALKVHARILGVFWNFKWDLCAQMLLEISMMHSFGRIGTGGMAKLTFLSCNMHLLPCLQHFRKAAASLSPACNMSFVQALGILCKI